MVTAAGSAENPAPARRGRCARARQGRDLRSSARQEAKPKVSSQGCGQGALSSAFGAEVMRKCRTVAARAERDRVRAAYAPPRRISLDAPISR